MRWTLSTSLVRANLVRLLRICLAAFTARPGTCSSSSSNTYIVLQSNFPGVLTWNCDDVTTKLTHTESMQWRLENNAWSLAANFVGSRHCAAAVCCANTGNVHRPLYFDIQVLELIAHSQIYVYVHICIHTHQRDCASTIHVTEDWSSNTTSSWLIRQDDNFVQGDPSSVQKWAWLTCKTN